MKLLADMGISMATVRALREAGEEVVHLREQGLHTMPDDQILAKGSGSKGSFSHAIWISVTSWPPVAVVSRV